MSEKRTEKERRRFILPAVLTAAGVVFLCLYLIFSRSGAGAAAEAFSRPVRRVLGAVSSVFPFALMELVYIGLGIAAVWFIVSTVRRVIRAEEKLFALAKRVFVLLLAALYGFTAYLWLWGIEYRAPSFMEREGIVCGKVSVDELYDAAEYFIDTALSLADSVARDGNGLFAADADKYFSEYDRVYSGLEDIFKTAAAPVHRPKKTAVFSEVMSRMGFTGVYFCFTGESCVNIRQPAAFMPCTLAHELAHQKGVASEQECNFLGVAAGMTSGIAEYRYSCAISGSVYLMNSLYKASPEKWKELYGKITGGMLADWKANNDYWRRKESKVTNVSQKAYDTFLKANGQSMGIASYGACVDLIVWFHKEYLSQQ